MCLLLNILSEIPRTANSAYYCREERVDIILKGLYIHLNCHPKHQIFEIFYHLIHISKVDIKIEFKGDTAKLNVIEYCQHHIPISNIPH
jgi:hypothetical protein